MPLLGCIAEDLAAATEHAFALAAEGLRCVLLIGLPAASPAAMPEDVRTADALVVALTARDGSAVRESLAALAWLQAAGCLQFCFAHAADCVGATTGPIGDALIAALGCGFALVSPAFPSRGPSVFMGHLFIGAAPAPDANLVRLLSRQTDGTVALVPYATVAAGAGAVRAAVTVLREQGHRYAIADAVEDAHLRTLGTAADGQPLITGSGGIAMGLASHLRSRAQPASAPAQHALWQAPGGRGAVLADAASRATRYQIGAARAHMPLLEFAAGTEPATAAAQALAWADLHWSNRPDSAPLLICAAPVPDRRAAPDDATAAMAEIAQALVARGLPRLVVAGQAVASAVVRRLGVRRLVVGPEIAPGVAWSIAHGTEAATPLLLALSDGHCSERYLFIKAFELLRGS